MPKREYCFWVYLLSNRSHILDVGMTNNIYTRVAQHRAGKAGSFTEGYKIDRLVWVELHQYVNDAIDREKQIKHWTRAQKIALIERHNPTWEELLPQSRMHGQSGTQIPFGNDKQSDNKHGNEEPSLDD